MNYKFISINIIILIHNSIYLTAIVCDIFNCGIFGATNNGTYIVKTCHAAANKGEIFDCRLLCVAKQTNICADGCGAICQLEIFDNISLSVICAFEWMIFCADWVDVRITKINICCLFDRIIFKSISAVYLI